MSDRKSNLLDSIKMGYGLEFQEGDARLLYDLLKECQNLSLPSNKHELEGKAEKFAEGWPGSEDMRIASKDGFMGGWIACDKFFRSNTKSPFGG